MGRIRHAKGILLVVFLMVALVVASCREAKLDVSKVPKAWIAAPRQGTELSAGTTEVPLESVPVMCHTFARNGVTHAELYVNGAFSSRLANTEGPGARYFNAPFTFDASAPGRYVLQCWAFDGEGAMGRSPSVTVTVSGEVPTATVTEEVPPTATATATEGPPTVTPTFTGTPTSTATATPTGTPTHTPTPTHTATTPPQPTISFEAIPPSTVQGQCITVKWDVENAAEVHLDGQGVAGHGSREECPTQTTTYTLVVKPLVGDDITETLTVTVTPGDTTGPQIYREAGPKVMAAPNPPYCTSPYLFQAYVNDESGVRWVKLMCSINQGAEQSCGGLQPVQTGSNLYRIDYALPVGVTSGSDFRWYIRACDLVDPMNCSNSGAHSVKIGACVT